MAERILVLGGTRSGKSAVAESLVAGAPAVTYVATSQPHDAELAQRVADHRARRPAHWETVETHDLTAALRDAPPGAAVLVDALGPWLAARMDAADLWAATAAEATAWSAEQRGAIAGLLDEVAALWAVAAAHPGGPVVVVADESGLGLLPADPSGRRWLDVAGDAVQALAADADRVLLVVAGRPVELRASGAPGAPRASGAPLAPAAPVPGGLRCHGDTMATPGALDLAVNTCSTAPHIREAIIAGLDDVGSYPDMAAARAALARRHGRAVDEVLVTAGAAEVFWLLPRIAAVRLAAVVHPSFTEPEAALRHAGVPVVHVPRDAARGWALDPSAVPEAADLVVLGNPNNPTGTLDPADTVASLCRPGRLTVVDEAFMDFTPDEVHSLAGRADLPGLVVVRSVTKLWGLPGVRGGYALAPAGLVARADAARQPWPVGTDALAALIACADDEDHRRRVARRIAADRDALAAALADLPGVTVTEGAANFLLLAVPDGPAVVRGLAECGVAVRPSTFPGLDEHHVRVAVRDTAASARLVAALRDVLTAMTARSTP